MIGRPSATASWPRHHLGERHDELAAAAEKLALAAKKLVEEMPRQRQIVVRLQVTGILLRDDGNARRRLAAPLVGVPVRRRRHQLRPDLAVLKDRVSLRL